MIAQHQRVKIMKGTHAGRLGWVTSIPAPDGLCEVLPYGNDGHRIWVREKHLQVTDEATPVEQAREDARALRENLVTI